MSTYRFALRGKWLIGHAIVLILAGLFILAGLWQLDRLDERKARNAEVRARRSSAVIPLERLVGPGAANADQAYERRVRVTGRYDPSGQVVVQFRPLDGQTGEYVLTPLVTADGSAVVVNRGWVPASGSDQPLPAEATPPRGEVTVTGLALPGESQTGLGPKEAREGRLAVLPRVDLPRIQQQVPYDLYPLYVQLQAQDPPQPAAAPRPVPLSSLDNGPHLSYAIQWFSFTAIGLVGWPLVIRRAARDRPPRPAGVTAPSGQVPVGR